MMSRKVVARIYRPTHVQQTRRFQDKLIGCTETSFTIFADGTTIGGVILSERKVRGLSGEEPPDPASPGLNLFQMDKVAAGLGIEFTNRSLKGDTWSDVIAKLDEDRLVQASVWVGVDHSIVLQARRKRPGPPAGFEILCNDPLDTAEKWVDEDVIHAQMREFRQRNGGDGLWFAYGRIRPKVAKAA